MKKMLFIIFALTPLVLMASQDAQTDIIPRTVNFLIFAFIVYYLLADKLKDYFLNRTNDIQKALDEVQNTLDESKKKSIEAQNNLDDARQIAKTLINDANEEIEVIKNKINNSIDQEINYLSKSFDDKLELETKKAKNQIVDEILNELLSKNNFNIKQDELVNIILKKVA